MRTFPFSSSLPPPSPLPFFARGMSGEEEGEEGGRCGCRQRPFLLFFTPLDVQDIGERMTLYCGRTTVLSRSDEKTAAFLQSPLLSPSFFFLRYPPTDRTWE